MEDLVREFLSAENARDWTKWASFLTEDITYTVVGSDNAVRGKASYVTHMQKVYAELPDWRFTVETLVADTDVVFVECLGRGHFTGIHLGRAYTAAGLELSAVCIFRFRHNKIASVREYFDHASYERQLAASV